MSEDCEVLSSVNGPLSIFLTSAEERVKSRHDLTLDYWRKNVDNLLTFQDKEILQGKSSVSNAEMESIVRKVYDEFDANRKHFDAQLADVEDMKALEDLQKNILILNLCSQ